MKYLRTTAIIFIFQIFFQTLAVSQPIAETENSYEETVITASKIDTTRRKFLNQNDLKKHQYASIYELLNSAISATTFNNASGSTTFFSRGALLNQVLVLLDGVPLIDPSTPQGTFDSSLFQTSFIDHVEIIQGDKTTEYGAYGAGTVINIHTKSMGQHIGAQWGSPQLFEGNGFATSPFLETDGDSFYNFFLGASYKKGENPSMVLDSHKNYLFENSFMLAKINFVLQKNQVNEWLGSMEFLNSTQNQNLGESGIDLDLFTSKNKSQIYQFHLVKSNFELFLTHAGFERGYKKFSEALSPYELDQKYLGSNDKFGMTFRHDILGGREIFGWEHEILNYQTLSINPSENSQVYQNTNSALWGKWSFFDEMITTGFRIQKNDDPYAFIYPEFQFKLGSVILSTSLSGLNPSIFQKMDTLYGNKNLKPQQTKSFQFIWTLNPSFEWLIYQNSFTDYISFDLNSNKYMNLNKTQTTGTELNFTKSLEVPMISQSEKIKILVSFQETYNLNSENNYNLENNLSEKTKMKQYPDWTVKTKYDFNFTQTSTNTSITPELEYQSPTDFSGTFVKEYFLLNLTMNQEFQNSPWTWGLDIKNLGHQKIQKTNQDWIQNTSLNLHGEMNF